MYRTPTFRSGRSPLPRTPSHPGTPTARTPSNSSGQSVASSARGPLGEPSFRTRPAPASREPQDTVYSSYVPFRHTPCPPDSAPPREEAKPWRPSSQPGIPTGDPHDDGMSQGSARRVYTTPRGQHQHDSRSEPDSHQAEELARLREENGRLQAQLQKQAPAPTQQAREEPTHQGAQRQLTLKLPDLDRDEIRRHAVLGGTGSVFRVTLAGFTFALKVISLTDPKAAKECEILQRLEHPNVVRYLGAQLVSARELHLFMEFVPLSLEVHMQTLREQGQQFKERELLRIALETCKGLHYLHNFPGVQIIHRDLKSKNILVDVDAAGEVDVVKLCDFGVSRMLATGSQADTMVGTYYWMAPEILANDATPYTAAADIWSLGMVLVELTTLRHPYFENNQNWALTKRMVLHGQTPYIDPAAPPRLRQLILACLRLRPLKRPATREILLYLTE